MLKQIMVTYMYEAFLQMSQASPLYKASHTPRCHFISGFCRVSLPEYLLVLRVYSLLLQVADSYVLPQVLSLRRGCEDDHMGVVSIASLLLCFCRI
jgi:hypothetical protein